MLKKILEKLRLLLKTSLIWLIPFCWTISLAQTDTLTTKDTVQVQIKQIQHDLDEIKNLCRKQRKLLEKKLKEKNNPK